MGISPRHTANMAIAIQQTIIESLTDLILFHIIFLPSAAGFVYKYSPELSFVNNNFMIFAYFFSENKKKIRI